MNKVFHFAYCTRSNRTYLMGHNAGHDFNQKLNSAMDDCRRSPSPLCHLCHCARLHMNSNARVTMMCIAFAYPSRLRYTRNEAMTHTYNANAQRKRKRRFISYENENKTKNEIKKMSVACTEQRCISELYEIELVAVVITRSIWKKKKWKRQNAFDGSRVSFSHGVADVAHAFVFSKWRSVSVFEC